jgi:purine nucleosidase
MAPPRPLIIDCDPGYDDAIALFLAFGSPELDVRLVTAVGGNAGLERTLRNACALVGLASPRVPVVAGADKPLIGQFVTAPYAHGEDGIVGVLLPDGPPAADGIAADAIRNALRTAETPLTLVGIGPATNLGLVLATEPALTERIAEIVLMTGAWGEGNATPAAEFNAWNDPEALAIVLGCGRPITLATLEIAAQALCTPDRVAQLHALGGGACLRAAGEIMQRTPPSRRLGGKGHAQFDACAIAWLIAPDLFTTREVHASVDLGPGPSRGRTVIDRWNRLGLPANARVLETLAPDRFFALLGERIATLP